MNEGLFSKYTKVLQEKKSEKEEALRILTTITGISFNENEIAVKNKVISFTTSSVKKSIIIQKNIQDAIKEQGYSIKIR